MSFTQMEGSVTCSGPNSLGNLHAMERWTTLYISLRLASKSIPNHTRYCSASTCSSVLPHFLAETAGSFLLLLAGSWQNFKPIFLLAIPQLIRIYLTCSSFQHCYQLIARYFPLSRSFGWFIFETKLVLNVVSGRQNHKSRPSTAEYCEHPAAAKFVFLSLAPGTLERR